MTEGGYGVGGEYEDALREAAISAPARPQYAYASWGSRVGAYVIDVVILAIALIIAIAVAFAIGTTFGVIVTIIGALIYFLGYWVYLEGGDSGQTLGKRALGIRVRSDDGSRAGYGKAFNRNLVGRLIGLIPFVGLIDVLWPLWDERNQCLHDKAASTIVVRG